MVAGLVPPGQGVKAPGMATYRERADPAGEGSAGDDDRDLRRG